MKREAEKNEAQTKEYTVSDSAGERVDIWLSRLISDYSRSYIQNLIKQQNVKLNGMPIKSNYKIKLGDKLTVLFPEAKELDTKPEDIPIEIIYEDEDLIVINKKKGMVVHPAAGNYSHTLVNALLGYCPDELSNINGVIRPGIVHRLDKDTSGLLVVAKNNNSHRILSEQLKKHEISRIYYTITDGVIPTDKGKIDAPVGRHPTERKKMAVNIKNGRDAVTHFTVLERFRNATLVKAELETGRTHQIRVHLAYIGFPVLGDEIYGRKNSNNKYNLNGQTLHAKILALTHPATGKRMEFEAPLPEYFEELLQILRLENIGQP